MQRFKSVVILVTTIVASYTVAGDVAVVPASKTVSAGAQTAAIRQAAAQFEQARRHAIENAIALAAAANAVGNQAQNAAVRDAIAQTNNERILEENNEGQRIRNSIANAQAVQIQIELARRLAARNAAIQAIQGDTRSVAQAVSNARGRALVESVGPASPILNGGTVSVAPINSGAAVVSRPAIIPSSPILSSGQLTVARPAIVPSAPILSSGQVTLGGAQLGISGVPLGVTGGQVAYTGAQLSLVGNPVGLSGAQLPPQLAGHQQLAIGRGPISPITLNTDPWIPIRSSPVQIPGHSLAVPQRIPLAGIPSSVRPSYPVEAPRRGFRLSDLFKWG